MLRDVLSDRGLPIGPPVRDVAALLAVPGSVLAGPSAARRHGITTASTDTFVALAGRRVKMPGIHVLRDAVSSQDACVIDGVPLTRVDRTVYDCLRLLPDSAAIELLQQALERGWTSVPQLAERLQLATNRHGTPRLVRILRAALVGDRAAAERLTLRLLQEAGIWGYRTGEPISDRWGLICAADIVVSQAKLVIELGGPVFEPGGARSQTEEDRRNRLLAAGWTVLCFTWIDLTTRPDEVIAEIRSAVDRLSPVRW